ncbi:MAG TPA: response regulator transcription factor [Burkholderiales bacterium]|nr:response regulator transcription factor [Burkholderiales bacterium]
MRILVAEDDPALQAALAFSLKQVNSYAVDLVADGVAADVYLQDSNFDLLVLDLGLPKIDGFEVLRRLRGRDTGLPVLIMSGRDQPEEKVRGLDMGADDYIVKPFSLHEFEARVRALLRRGLCGSATQITRGTLCFDTVTRIAMVEGKPLKLSSREAALLEVLVKQFGRVVTKDRLMEHLYSCDEAPGDNAIEVFIHRLRKKLAGSPVTVATFYGHGYQLDYRNSEPAVHN